MWRPWRFSKPSIIACGAAAPPTIIDRSRDRSHLSGSASSSCRIPIQIVGTPAVTVTFCSTKASSSDGGSRCGPGKTCSDADERAREREAPGVGVEHRHDRQHDVRPRRSRASSTASRRASGSRSRDASRRRPWAAPWCRSCNTSPPPSARRCPGRRTPRRRPSRAAPRTRSRRAASRRRRPRSRARSRRGRLNASTSGHSVLSAIRTRSPACVAM